MPISVPETLDGLGSFRVPQGFFDAYKNNEDRLLAEINGVRDRLNASIKREKRLATSLDQAKNRVSDLERQRKEDVHAQEDELGCPICASVLVDPYGFVPCGHCVCGTCAVQWIDTQSANHGLATCPECRDHLSTDCPIVANRPLDKIIIKWIEKRTGDDGDGWDGYRDWLERKETWDAYKLVHPTLIDEESFRRSLGGQRPLRGADQLPDVRRWIPPFTPWFSPPPNTMRVPLMGGDSSDDEPALVREFRQSNDFGEASLYNDPEGGMVYITAGMPDNVQSATGRRYRRGQGLMEAAARQRRQRERQQREAGDWVHQGFGSSDAEDIIRRVMRDMVDSEPPDIFSLLDGMRNMNRSLGPMSALLSHFETRF